MDGHRRPRGRPAITSTIILTSAVIESPEGEDATSQTTQQVPGPSIEQYSYWREEHGGAGSWSVERILVMDGEYYVDLQGTSFFASSDDLERRLVPALTLLRDYRRDDHSYPPEPVLVSCRREGCLEQDRDTEEALGAKGWSLNGMGGAYCPEHASS